MAKKHYPKRDTGAYLTSVLFVLAGALVTICTALYILGISGPIPVVQLMARGGAFLFRSFHIGAFLIACYFFSMAVLVSTERSARFLLFLLVASAFPILTFSLGMRLIMSSDAYSPITHWVGNLFGVYGAAGVSFLITAALIISIIQVRKKLTTPAREQSPQRDPHQRDDESHLALPDSHSTDIQKTESEDAVPAQQKESEVATPPLSSEPAADTTTIPPSFDITVVSPLEPAADIDTSTPPPTASSSPADADAPIPSFDITVVSPPEPAADINTDAPPQSPVFVFHSGRFYSESSMPEYPDTPSDTVDIADTADITSENYRIAPEIDDASYSDTSAHQEEYEYQANHEHAPSPHTQVQSPPPIQTQAVALLDPEDDELAAHDEHAYQHASLDAAPLESDMATTHTATHIATTKHEESEDIAATHASYPVITSAHAVQEGDEPSWYLDPTQLLTSYPPLADHATNAQTAQVAQRLVTTLKEFNVDVQVIGIQRGPAVTVYELLPARGVKLTKISALADNIALSLAAPRVRIVAPIPGKQAVGIELPNDSREVVGFDSLVLHDDFQDPDSRLPIALGKGVSGEVRIIDLASTPHLLIAGATGSGKSVCVNAIISSLLFRCSPAHVRMLLIDPKIVELKLYNDIPHLISPVITDTKEAMIALNYCIVEMENRYRLLDEYGVRDIKGYNRAISSQGDAQALWMPYIVVVIDEFADLMITGGKQLELAVSRLTAMSRAVGIHLILATQRPSADVITGLIKANIPTRIAFMVASKVDSRIILDNGGADQLLGQGDMLFVSPWESMPIRMQGALITDEEVSRITAAVKEYGPPDYINIAAQLRQSNTSETEEGQDTLYDEALQIVQESGKASASYLQRRLQVGYNRAARIIEEMEERGIVGPPNGSKARELL